MYDPYDSDLDREPYEAWRRLRDEAPLYRNDELGFYALSRYADVLAGLTDWETYASGRGTILELIDPLAPEVDGDPEGQPMIFTDPPYHDMLRGVVSRWFTPRRVSTLERSIRSLCRDGLDRVAGSHEFDFVGDVVGDIPAMVIGELLGFPSEDQRQLARWTDQFLHYDPSLEPEGQVLGFKQYSRTRMRGMVQLMRYVDAHIDERALRPSDDLISELLAAQIDRPTGKRGLTRPEVSSFVLLLFAAGAETTARLLGWSAILLARHPGQRQRLVGDRSLLVPAVEELLRYETPSPIQARWVSRDVELHGQVVPRGSKMALLNAAANRDERQFDEPDRFDIERATARNLAFGYGTHFCLGAALARLEGRVVIDETLDGMPSWDVDEAAVEFVRTTTVRGPAKVPISR